MASVKASDWKNVMNLIDKPTDTQAEYILDLAINCLNAFGASLSNMAGDTPGSKTVTLTSKEEGIVFIAANHVYHGFFKRKQSVGVGGVSITVNDVMVNSVVWQIIEKLAKRLEAKKAIPFVVAHADY